MLHGRVNLQLNHLVVSLATALVLYHVGQLVLAPVLWASVLLPHSTPVVQHPNPTPTMTASPVAVTWPTQAVMPTVGIDLPLTGSVETNGAWEISETGANVALNTAAPNGRTGNTVLFGHDRAKLFHNIHNLRLGDPIMVVTKETTYVYTMAGTQSVPPADVAVMNQTTAPKLTLITCDGWLSQNRFVVTANFSHALPHTTAPIPSTLENRPTF